jgi:hypothetical protein
MRRDRDLWHDDRRPLIQLVLFGCHRAILRAYLPPCFWLTTPPGRHFHAIRNSGYFEFSET